MLDINFIRDNLDKVKKSVEVRKAQVDLNKLLSLDDDRKKLIQQVDDLRAKRNENAKAKNIEAGKKIKQELGDFEKKLAEYCRHLVNERDTIVYVAGLPVDIMERPFPTMAEIMPYANNLIFSPEN